MRGLAAIAAIFSTAAGLDREQPAHLDGIGVEMAPMNRVGAEQQIVERQFIKLSGVRLCPGLILGRGDRGRGRVVRRCWHLVLSGHLAVPYLGGGETGEEDRSRVDVAPLKIIDNFAG